MENNPQFKKYSLTIEILSKYGEYEANYSLLRTFLDRNKQDGFRLYYKPYAGEALRYCLCSIETSQKENKLQPVLLTLTQDSFWYGIEQTATTSPESADIGENLFVFAEDDDGYYSAQFKNDESVAMPIGSSGYYSIAFYGGIENVAQIVNNSYNEVPVAFRIKNGINPIITIYKQGSTEALKRVGVLATIEQNYYLEINADILNSGVWLVNERTGAKVDYTERVDYSLGSPYVFLGNGTYRLSAEHEGGSALEVTAIWQGEYSD
ncbi:MAG: hypothetical protein IKW45_06705 [Clostridia bacterium]|nr:hypothetical protein [Clostridia bacterium]